MDESDLRALRQARAELEAADAVTRAKRSAYYALIQRIYAGKERGDVNLLAEVTGLSTAQVKRIASGETSGNRPKGRA